MRFRTGEWSGAFINIAERASNRIVLLVKIIGARTLKTLSVALAVVFGAAIVALALDRDEFLFLLALAWVLATLFLAIQGGMLIVHLLQRRNLGVSRALRRSAMTYGVPLVALGALTWLAGIDPVTGAAGSLLFLIGLGAIATAWATPVAPPEVEDTRALGHTISAVASIVIALLIVIVLPKFAGTKTKAYQASTQSDLRNLVMAEEVFFSDSARFSNNLTALNFLPTSGVTAPTVTAGETWWSATNSHTQEPNYICGVGVNTTNPVSNNAESGDVACR
jgi:type II secretory pathway pseudopilin PulG